MKNQPIKDLKELVKLIKPKLIKGDFVFCSIPEKKLAKLKINSLLTFREREGITIILEKKQADKNKLIYSDIWKLITLDVYSDLNAVGFLARITNKLARLGISVNVISAYYHDHLFVPKEKLKQTINILNHLSK